MFGKSLALSLLAAGRLASAVTIPAEQGSLTIPGSFIVEFEDGHEDTAAFDNEIGADAQVKVDLKFSLFKGASIQFHETDTAEETAEKIAQMPAVKRIWPQRRYKIPDYTVHWSGSPSEAQAASMTKRQSNETDTFSPHVMTQVNQLRDKGIVGQGIKVAVIDTGVDYKHPALGGCFGPGCLVAFGTDLVGDAYDGSNVPQPDDDPMDCGGHGTHVSGTIAAQTNNPYGIIGAATGVTLGIYRVFGCTGQTTDEVLIQAYNKAYEDGADIISASIGGSSGWSEEAWSVTVSRIVAKGVPCVVSAGNEGDSGLFFASSAAEGKGVTAIASIDNTLTPSLLVNSTYTVDGGQDNNFGYTPGTPSDWANITLPLWAVSFDTTDPANGCDPLPDSTPDLTDRIVLVRRGTCAFVQKATNLRAKGARYIIFYNNVAGTILIDVSDVSGILASATVDPETGAAWIADLAAGKNLTLTVKDPLTASKFLVTMDNTRTGGYASTFTTWGPTYEVDVKPQLASPGGNILSTYPLALGGYATLSGTSMACPLTAAVYALLMNVRGTKDPRTLENLLSATANPNLFNDGSGASEFLAPVAQQGAGLIQAYDAAYATTLLSASSLSFNDTDNFQPEKNFTITNLGSTAVTYQLSHRGAATGYTFAESGSVIPDVFPNELVESYATIEFDEQTVKVEAGASKVVAVIAAPPAGLNASRLAVYSGYVVINGSDSSSLSLPYLGVYGSMHGHAALDPELTFLSTNKIASNESADDPPPVESGHVFAMPPPGLANDTRYANNSELPRLSINLAFGTAVLRADVVALEASANETEVLGLKTIGSLVYFPQTYQPRLRSFVRWEGLLSSGNYAPNGLYKIVLRTLRVFGDPTKPEEYDSVETVPFRLQYLE